MGAESAAAPRALFAANRGFALARSRRGLMEQLIERGWKVVVATADDEHSRGLTHLGVTLEPVAFDRGGLAPMADLAAYRRLGALCRRYRPRLLHLFHAKPVILGGLAARRTGSGPVVATITGLGQAFERSALVRCLAGMGYGQALAGAAAVVFQNPDDRRLFLERGWVRPEAARLLVGSGVDTERFRPREDADRGGTDEGETGRLTVLMAARLLGPKGVHAFVEAARRLAPELAQEMPGVRFVLAGEADPVHPEAVPGEWLEAVAAEGVVEIAGYRPRLEEDLRRAAVFVLPSTYREGVPRVLLEAAACGVPAVTTDAPGCREAVTHGETGLLVPPGDVDALADAIRRLLDDGALRRKMGAAARRRAVAEWDLGEVTRRQLEIYRQVGVVLDERSPR